MLELARPVLVSRRLLRWFRSVLIFRGILLQHCILKGSLHFDEEVNVRSALQVLKGHIQISLIFIKVDRVVVVIFILDCEFRRFRMGEDLKDFL